MSNQYIPAGSYQGSVSGSISVMISAICLTTAGTQKSSTLTIKSDNTGIGDIANINGLLTINSGTTTTSNSNTKLGAYIPAGSYQNSVVGAVTITITATCKKSDGSTALSSLTFSSDKITGLVDIGNIEGVLIPLVGSAVLDASSGLVTENPKMDNGKLSAAIDLVNANGKNSKPSFTINGQVCLDAFGNIGDLIWDYITLTNTNLEGDCHIESFAPYHGSNNHKGAFSAAAPSQAYFVTFDGTTTSDATVKNAQRTHCATNLPTSTSNEHFKHAGGIQYLGDYLIVGIESDKSSACVEIWYAPPGKTPVYKQTIGLIDGSTLSGKTNANGEAMVGKASACAATTYSDSSGKKWVLITSYDWGKRGSSNTGICGMYFFRAPYSQYWPVTLFEQVGHYATIKNNSIFANNTDSSGNDSSDTFENFVLVTESPASGTTGDVVYLLGFNSSEAIHCWKIDTSSTPCYGDFSSSGHYGYPSNPDSSKPDTIKYWDNFNDVNWQYAIGLQIVSSTEVRIFAYSDNSSDPTGDTTTGTLSTGGSATFGQTQKETYKIVTKIYAKA